MSVYDTLVSTAAKWPDKIAIVDSHGKLTFEGLLSETEKLKDKLICAGIERRNGVGILTQNNRYFLIALYASLGCRAVVMPIGYQTSNEITDAVVEADLHFLIAEKKNFRGSDNIRLAALEDDAFDLYSTDRRADQPTVPFISDAALMRFTSGTTGAAKCVILSHRTVLERIQAANEGLGLSADDRVLWVLPMAFHFIVSIIMYVRYGVGIVVCTDFLADTLLEKANNHHATVLYSSPLHIRLLAASKTKTDFNAMRKVISTTTGISKSVCEMFYHRFQIPVMQAFGIIEVGLPMINTRGYNDRPEAVGHPLPAFKTVILDESLHPVPAGRIGLLSVGGPGMFDGYLKPPTLAVDILKDGMFITGDYAEETPEGLIVIHGRANAMIHVLGNKVFPDEVEHVLLQYPGVQQARVYGEPHPLLGEMVVSEIIIEDISFDEEKIIKHCRNLLTSYKVPQRITQVKHIDVTGSGKIKRG